MGRAPAAHPAPITWRRGQPRPAPPQRPIRYDWWSARVCARKARNVVAYAELETPEAAHAWVEQQRLTYAGTAHKWDVEHEREVHRLHLGRAVSYALTLPAAEARAREQARLEREARAEGQRRAAESRRLNREAAAFEQLHGLPPVRSAVGSARQLGFGTRCRYQMLRGLSAERIAQLRPELSALTDAGLWIAAFVRERPLHELIPDPDEGGSAAA